MATVLDDTRLKHFVVAFLLGTICYIAFGYYGKYMPWGRVDPIVALHYISLADPSMFSRAALAFDIMRPLNLWPYLLITKSPLQGGEIWYLYKTALIFLAGVGIYLFIYEFLSRKEILFPALISLLFVVNPVGGWEKINQVLLVSQFSAACIFLSYYLFLLSDRLKSNSKSIVITLALMLNLMGFLMYECAFLLSLGICALIYIKNHKAQDKKQNPYHFVIVPVLVVVYKLFYFSFEDVLVGRWQFHSSASKGTLLLDPGDLLSKLLSGYYVSLYDGWKIALNIMPRNVSVFAKYLLICSLMISLVGLAVIISRLLKCVYKGKPLGARYRFHLNAIGVGFVFSFLGYFPLLIAAHYPLDSVGRVHDYANPGLCVVIVSIVMLVCLELGKLRKIFSVMVAFTLVFLGVSQYHFMSESLASRGKQEYDFWFDFTRKVPLLRSNTIIVLNGYPRKSFAPETKSYYCNLILLGLYSDPSVRILVFEDKGEYEYEDDRFIFSSKVPLEEVNSCTSEGGYRGWEYMRFATTFTQLYYLTELRKYEELAPNKEYVIPSERVIVLDYNPYLNRSILNEEMSNLNAIIGERQSISVFFKQFLGVSEFRDIYRMAKGNKCPGYVVKYHLRANTPFKNKRVVFVRGGLKVTGDCYCVGIANLTADGWVTAEGIVLIVPIDVARKYPLMVLSGDYHGDYLKNLKARCTLIREDLERLDLNAFCQFENGKYDIRVNLADIIEEVQFEEYVCVELKFNEYFVPKFLDINPDTRKLVVQLSRDLVFEK